MSSVKFFFKFFLLLTLSLALFLPAWSNYPQRIISGIPSVTEMLFALGLGGRVVGVTTNCNYPPEAKNKEKVGGFTLNLEKIVYLKPDLIIMVEDAQKPEIEKLRKMDLPVLSINPKTVSGVMDSLIQLGKATGEREKAERLVWAMKRRLSAAKPHGLRAILNLPKVLVVVGMNPLVVAGGGTFIDDIVKYAGGDNIAEKAKGAYPQFNFESLAQANPDFIIVPKGMLVKDERWSWLKAKICYIDADIISRPGPRVVDAVEQIAGFIHDKN